MAHHRSRYAEETEVDRIRAGIFFRRIENYDSLEPQEDPVVQPGPRVAELKGFPIPKAQLISEDEIDCLPLLEVSLNVKVSATISRTLLTQSFMNYTNIPVNEPTTPFPCRIKSKEEAVAEFCEAVRRRRAAALLQEHTPEVFEVNLGLIPAQTKVKVEVTYINELKADLGGDGVLVTIPTSVAARYGNPPLGFAGRPVAGSSVGTTESGLKIQVEVSAPVPIRTIECRTHPISVELGAEGHATATDSFGDLLPGSNAAGYNPNKARATLTDQNASLSRDFVLLILTSSPGLFTSRALVEQHPDLPDRLAMMVSINPYDLFASHLSSTTFGGEIIFVVDRSGSMASKMKALKIAMRVFLKSLPLECRFNICSFGSTWSSLWPRSREYSHETLSLAENHIATSCESDVGGTVLLPALQGIVRECITLGDLNTEIIVLTDGEVWQTEETIDFVRSTRTDSLENIRFFALGIGDAVSHRLVEGIGRQGGGFAEVVAVDAVARWEPRVIRMLKGALTPPRWQCKVRARDTSGNLSPLGCDDTTTRADTEGLAEATIQQPACVQAPFRIPSLHAFSRCSVYFLLDKQKVSDLSSINVLGVTSTGEEISVDIPLEEVAFATTIHFLAAKALMNDLETGQSWLHAENLETYRNTSPDEFERTVRNQAETYGRDWGITGKWTSFVAVHSSTQVELASRIYRADRSELSDLTRPIYRAGYDTGSLHPSAGARIRSCRHAHGKLQSISHTDFSYATNAGNYCSTSTPQGAQSALVLERKHYSSPFTGAYSDDSDPRIPNPQDRYPTRYVEYKRSCGPPQRTGLAHGSSEAINVAAPNTNEQLNVSTDLFHPLPPDSESTRPKLTEDMLYGSSIADTTTVGMDDWESARGLDRSLVSRSTSPLFIDLIDQQSYQGFFNLQAAVRESVLNKFPPHLLDRMLRLPTGGNGEEARQTEPPSFERNSELICETLVAIVYIENHYASSSELWELVVRKASDWVRKQVGSEIVIDELADLVRKCWQQSDDASMLETSDTLQFFPRGSLGKRKDTASTGDTSLERSCEPPLKKGHRPKAQDRERQ